MKRVLVTGATGTLGRQLTARLRAAGYLVRGLSRGGHTPSGGVQVEWLRGDLTTGEGLGDAMRGIDVVVHAATVPGRHGAEVDVGGTGRLIAAARAAGVGHLIYVSIVGLEHIPTAYFRHKRAAEALIADSGLPWSIQRATQFHHFLDGLLHQLAPLPVWPLPTDLLWQPMDPGVLAQSLVSNIGAGPGGRLPDIGGPEMRSTGELARVWLTSRGLRRPIIHLPLPGRLAAALRAGAATCPTGQAGGATWAEWLAARAGTSGAQREVRP